MLKLSSDVTTDRLFPIASLPSPLYHRLFTIAQSEKLSLVGLILWLPAFEAYVSVNDLVLKIQLTILPSQLELFQ
ncbi:MULTISPECIES: hypothetical protein [unclassified Microcoleus]|uniref:hypothetical protein n=1 Tax=unclassified Microcoleus TaxID=2642155 RepID=UPI002FCE8AF5